MSIPDRIPEYSSFGSSSLLSHGRVSVIEAGPTGLTAAYLLAKEGVSVTVLEAVENV